MFLDGWMDGWVGGWMGVKAVLRIAYSNQKSPCDPYFSTLHAPEK
jgi:hypothetical protein